MEKKYIDFYLKNFKKLFFSKNNKIFIFFLIFLLGAGIYFFQEKKFFCPDLPSLSGGEERVVTKVIDGDTFLIEGGYSVRILGIDADEKGYPCYERAKKRLEELILGKKIRLEKGKENIDKYCRYLRYPIIEGKNIALTLIEEGLVVARVSKKDKYSQEIIEKEKKARESKIGCKWEKDILVEKEQIEDFLWNNLTEEKTGLKVVNACGAENYYGKEMIVQGKIVSSYRSKKNNVFLNFEKPYPDQCFSVVIFSSDLSNFGPNPEDYYLEKTVRVKGKIKEYKKKPEIILNHSDQIEIGQ